MHHESESEVTQSCPTLCDPMNQSTPGLPVHHQLPELAQTHVSRVADDIQPCHPLSSPSSLTSIILHLVFPNLNFVIISNSENNGKNITKNIHTFFTQMYQLLTFYTLILIITLYQTYSHTYTPLNIFDRV